MFVIVPHDALMYVYYSMSTHLTIRGRTTYICGPMKGEPTKGPSEGACSMAVPAVSTRPRTSALRMPSTHPANHR